MRSKNVLGELASLDPKRLVLISAGEASADLHASRLIRELRSLAPELVFFGMGGDNMAAEGFIPLVDAKEISVVGITEVIPKIRTILRARWTLKDAILNLRPKWVVFVDLPDFHMSLLPIAKKAGSRIIYFIPPQIWAWRSYRIKRFRRYVHKALVILPFEETLYRSHGMDAIYVGNPLLEMYLEPKPYYEGNDLILGLLPGSRDKEVERNLPVMWEACRLLKKEIYELRVLISCAPSISEALLHSILGPLPPWAEIMKGAQGVLKDSTVCCIVSGTATLEAALMPVPMVVLYKLSKTSYMLGKLLARVPFISLPNLIAGKRIVPELIQDEASPMPLYRALRELFLSQQKRKAMIDTLLEVRSLLSTRSSLKDALRECLI